MLNTTLVLVVMLVAGTAALRGSGTYVDNSDLAKACLEKAITKAIVDIDDTIAKILKDVMKTIANGDEDNIKKILEDAKEVITNINANTDDDTAEILQDVLKAIDNGVNSIVLAKFSFNFGKYLVSSDTKSFLSFFEENPVTVREAMELLDWFQGTDSAQDPASNIKEQL